MWHIYNKKLDGSFGNQKEFNDAFYNKPFSGPLFSNVTLSSSNCGEDRYLNNSIEDELYKDYKNRGSKNGLFILRNFQTLQANQFVDIWFFAANLSKDDYKTLSDLNNTYKNPNEPPRFLSDIDHLVKGFGREYIYETSEK